MDEPTSGALRLRSQLAISPDSLVRASGVSIVYVSLKLDELLAISDRITVLRDGKFVQTVPSSQADRDTIVRFDGWSPLQAFTSYTATHVQVGTAASGLFDFTQQEMATTGRCGCVTEHTAAKS